MNQNLPLKVQSRISKLDTYGNLVKESLRAISYSIGVVAYRLILLNKDESEDKYIPRISLMYSLMMSAHKPELIWLDEIAEALMNCAEGLNTTKYGELIVNNN